MAGNIETAVTRFLLFDDEMQLSLSTNFGFSNIRPILAVIVIVKCKQGLSCGLVLQRRNEAR